ncbi:4-(cytidine 5'-diphospho)-2-C-methyl-D-erythritol kinase [Palleronia caenipelagi]|uniref:4-diphosphocytidyl-2-C-methyl-D-erythritol kinase n=1 Tax=Palleronia caenipelagi TaxID=2489174 RepID=A0A547Q5P4_9RHOB|nr:4-(cytidine 5'-diphospho)-2-C-methyl-D-erythritol kinase [Palleronia caenipelagi]TRD21705.1 4-(cytidine 5'-diphospho)-2-C-methyl-D-erythritol kinase [Palleronia caenipelagi]
MAADAGFAPAKVNLALHVTGRRDDGYHLLDSLVVFAGVGDRIDARPAGEWSLEIIGPFGGDLAAAPDNLVLRAARLTDGPPAALTLDKRLPVASGIGGGSADAAATLRALHHMDGRPLPTPEAVLSLGADVPVCLHGQPCRMSGIGETLSPLPALPPLWLCLLNSGEAVPTPAVFRALERRDNRPLGTIPEGRDAAEFAAWLGTQRNDLQAPATQIAPVISEALDALTATEGCFLARMSGSGATCFGLYASDAAAEAAANKISAAHPDWWTAAAPVL